jgi:LysR family hydrogen peroxide-inducible transcriptional activator
MEIHQLRYFTALAATRNFSRAAERCNVSQPSLSQQIMKLEGELGDRLFERGGREIVLTAAGELFRPHAERVLDELERARDAVDVARGRLRGRVRLGVIPTIAPYYLPGMLRDFSARHPDIEVVVTEAPTAQLVRAMETRELDLALVSLPVAGRGLTAKAMFEEGLWLALPAGHALAQRDTVKMSELVDEPFLLLQDGHCLAGQALEFCAMRGFAPKVTFRGAQLETIQAFVAAGAGLSMVPAMARRDTPARPGAGGVVYRGLQGRTPSRVIGLLLADAPAPSGAGKALAEFMSGLGAPKPAGRADGAGA